MELTILLLTVLPISVFGLAVPSREHFSYGQGSSEGSEANAGSMVEGNPGSEDVWTVEEAENPTTLKSDMTLPETDAAEYNDPPFSYERSWGSGGGYRDADCNDSPCVCGLIGASCAVHPCCSKDKAGESLVCKNNECTYRRFIAGRH